MTCLSSTPFSARVVILRLFSRFVIHLKTENWKRSNRINLLSPLPCYSGPARLQGLTILILQRFRFPVGSFVRCSLYKTKKRKRKEIQTCLRLFSCLPVREGGMGHVEVGQSEENRSVLLSFFLSLILHFFLSFSFVFLISFVWSYKCPWVKNLGEGVLDDNYKTIGIM
jgi:hypothetical protein